jgi:Zinc finger, C3HC4 type (RING finger)
LAAAAEVSSSMSVSIAGSINSIMSLIYVIIDVGYISTLVTHIYQPSLTTASSLLAFDIALVAVNLLANSQMRLDSDISASLITLTMTTASNLSMCSVAIYNGHYMSDAERITVITTAVATSIAILITAWLIRNNGEEARVYNVEDIVDETRDVPGSNCRICKQRKAIVVSVECGHRFVCAKCCNQYNREGDSFVCLQCERPTSGLIALDDRQLTLICANYTIDTLPVIPVQ